MKDNEVARQTRRTDGLIPDKRKPMNLNTVYVAVIMHMT